MTEVQKFRLDSDKCIHSAQVGFAKEGGEVICTDCGKKLVWLQASQLANLRKQVEAASV